MDSAKLKQSYDVIAVGSGAAGLMGALVAMEKGASVLLLEKSAFIGGTTAVSGGVIWVPNNHHMQAKGLQDSEAEALTYLKRIAQGRADEALMSRYLETSPAMVRYLEAHSDVRLDALETYPDYHPEFEGGKGGGRSLDNDLFRVAELGEHAGLLRKNPITGRAPLRIAEAMDWNVFSQPMALPYKVIKERVKGGLVHGGASLCGNLLKALLAGGVDIVTEASVEGLLQEGQRVTGVRVLGKEIAAEKGVLLGTGGFEWSEKLNRQFLAGVISHPTSPPANTGDGLRFAMAAGADLANMSEAWWCPVVALPGEEYDGAPLYRSEFSIRTLPHSMIVNRRGQRFTSEAQNYNAMTKPFFDYDAVEHEYKNLPAWLIVDGQFLSKYMLVTNIPGAKLPEWVEQAPSLKELAEKVGIDAAGLLQTVERFNGFADSGVDLDFRRGESVYDQYYGDPRVKPNPNLGRLEQAPFVALPIYPGSIGTKGGALTDEHSRVVRADGSVVEGLYAAGNVAASITGPGYPGAGSTIGTALTWAYLASHHMLGDPQ